MPDGVRRVERVRISHVVWDWNGTLLDDNTAVLAAVNAVCVDFGRADLTWPEWQFAPKNDSAGATREMLANDLRALLIIVFVFGILAMVAKGIGSGGVGFIVGWVALILGAALAAFLTYFLKTDASFSGPNSALVAFQSGGSYGLFVGWLVGIATATAKKG